MEEVFVSRSIIRAKAVFIQHRPHRLRGNQHDEHVDDSSFIHGFLASDPNWTPKRLTV